MLAKIVLFNLTFVSLSLSLAQPAGADADPKLVTQIHQNNSTVMKRLDRVQRKYGTLQNVRCYNSRQASENSPTAEWCDSRGCVQVHYYQREMSLNDLVFEVVLPWHRLPGFSSPLAGQPSAVRQANLEEQRKSILLCQARLADGRDCGFYVDTVRCGNGSETTSGVHLYPQKGGVVHLHLTSRELTR